MVNRVLVIRLRQLGDTLLVTPALRQLKRAYPNARIDVLCESGNRCIFENHPAVSNCLLLRKGAPAKEYLAMAWQLRRNRYDLIVDSQSLPKTAILSRLAGGRKRVGLGAKWGRGRITYTHPYFEPSDFLDYAGQQNLKLIQDPKINIDDTRLELVLSESDRELGDEFAKTHFKTPTVAMYATGRASFRHARYWSEEKFAELGDWLHDSGFQVFMAYGPGEERELAVRVANRMKTPPLLDYPSLSFPQLGSVIRHCQLYVGCDGGPKHLAAAFGVPSISLFGMIHPERWTDVSDPKQQYLATRQYQGATHRSESCLEIDQIHDIPVSAVIEQIKNLGKIGYLSHQVPKTAA